MILLRPTAVLAAAVVAAAMSVVVAATTTAKGNEGITPTNPNSLLVDFVLNYAKKCTRLQAQKYPLPRCKNL